VEKDLKIVCVPGCEWDLFLWDRDETETKQRKNSFETETSSLVYTLVLQFTQCEISAHRVHEKDATCSGQVDSDTTSFEWQQEDRWRVGVCVGKCFNGRHSLFTGHRSIKTSKVKTIVSNITQCHPLIGETEKQQIQFKKLQFITLLTVTLHCFTHRKQQKWWRLGLYF